MSHLVITLPSIHRSATTLAPTGGFNAVADCGQHGHSYQSAAASPYMQEVVMHCVPQYKKKKRWCLRMISVHDLHCCVFPSHSLPVISQCSCCFSYVRYFLDFPASFIPSVYGFLLFYAFEKIHYRLLLQIKPHTFCGSLSAVQLRQTDQSNS